MLEELYTVQQLAALIHKKISSIYSDMDRRPESLPPIFRATPTSKPLFVNPRQWVLDRGQLSLPKQSQPKSNQEKTTARKRGRPSNKEKGEV